MRPNKKPGKCCECSAKVPAMAGTITPPPANSRRWLVFCADCGDSPEVAAVVSGSSCALTLHAQGVQAELTAAYGADQYWPFRNATKSAKGIKVGGDWINVLGWDDFAAALVELQNIEGLILTIAPEVTEAMRGRAGVVADLVDAARDRLDAADRLLAGSGLALYDYQRAGVEFMASQSAAMLSDQMGLGKTVQTLLALPKAGDVRAIIVGPAVAKAVWMRELRKWRSDLADVCKISILKGRKSFRVPAPGEILITNYEILNAVDDLGDDCDLDGVQLIADEAHALKNPKAKRTIRFRDLAARVRAGAGGKVWLLTATPLLGKPPELYALLSALGRVPFTSFKAFAVAAGGVEGNWGWEWGHRPVCPSIAEALRPIMLRRTKSDVGAQLPELSSRVVDMDLAGSGIQSVLDAALESWDALGDRAPTFEELSHARALLASAKIPTMLALVEEYEAAQEPLVVFSAHRAPIDLLAERDGWAVITGDTSPEERGQIQDAFQAGELLGVGATIKAGGVAITLTRASNAVIVDLDWTPALNAQAAARVHRLGSERPVMITNILADHALDRRLLEILSVKSDLIAATVDAARVSDLVETPTALRGAALVGLANEADAITAENAGALDAMAAKIARWNAAAECAAKDRNEARWQKLIAERLENRGLAEVGPGPELSAACGACDGIETDRRLALGPVENWAVYALGALVSMDQDRAQVENGIGFNQADTMLGHALADRARAGLSAGEWRLAVAMLAKYHGQIGRRPGA